MPGYKVTLQSLCTVTVILALCLNTTAQKITHAPLLSAHQFDIEHVSDTSANQPVKSEKIKYGRLALVGGAAVSTLGGTYIFLQNAWWKDQATDFHFDQGRDLKYAVNLDKMGHFLGGVFASDMFFHTLRWANVPEEKAHWYGAGFGTFIQLAIEVKDGYAPRWGFSKYDVLAGTVGSLFTVGQYYSGFLSDLDMKISYYPRSRRYFEYNKNGHLIDDYINQNYWISWNVNNYLPEKLEKYWPDFLALAAGVGIDETTDGRGGGNYEIYLALDYDLKAILKNKQSRFWKTTKHLLNYIKLPAPAIRFSPTAKAYIFYF